MDNRMVMMRGASRKVAIMHTDLTGLLPGARRALGTREGRVIDPEAVLAVPKQAGRAFAACGVERARS